MTFFLVIASVAVHNLPSRKAWLVFGIIGGLLVFVSISAEISARAMRNQAEQFREMGEKSRNG
jgi:hypothetical protein